MNPLERASDHDRATGAIAMKASDGGPLGNDDMGPPITSDQSTALDHRTARQNGT
jgi:hypothetical protein